MLLFRYLLIALLLLVFVGCGASKTSGKTSASAKKSFEGTIVYDMVFEDRTGAIPKEKVLMIIGDQSTYKIRGDQYVSEMNGKMSFKSYYLGGDTIYNAMSGMENLFWLDATENENKILDFTIEENAANILENSCDLLTIRSEKGVLEYYYNPLLKVDQKQFQKHNYQLWNFCIEKTGALPVKTVSDMRDQYVELTATEIITEKIPDSVFELPSWPRTITPTR